MNEQVLFREKISKLVCRERIRHRQRILIASLCYALVASLAMVPAAWLLPVWANPWMIPLFFFLLIMPMLFFRYRWDLRHSARVIARLDKTLGLDERAITAWEILARGQMTAPEHLVVKQAGARLQFVEPASFVQWRLTWQGYLILPLLALWAGLLWFDFRPATTRAAGPSTPKSLAQKLDEFSRELKGRAKAEELPESLRAGHELEKLAQKSLLERAEESLRKDLVAMSQKMASAGESFSTEFKMVSGETLGGLRELKAELEAARDTLRFRDGSKGEGEMDPRLLDNLTGLPRLGREVQREMPAGERLREAELKSFLDRLEKDVASELDRRTLLEAQQFIEALAKQGQDQPGERDFHVAARGEEDFQGEGEKDANASNLPGHQPGEKMAAPQPLPQFAPGATTHLKGLLGGDKSAGVVLKAQPHSGKSEIGQEEVVARYERQAEEALNSERIPEALKDTVRNYFLSLGMGREPK